MTPRAIFSVNLSVTLLWVIGQSVLNAAAPRYPVAVSRFELATREELLYSHWLRPLVESEDSSQWTWPQEFVSASGRWVAAYVDGQKILEATHHGCPVDGQPALAPLDRVVADCANLLGIAKPQVIVRSDPSPRAYIVAIADEPYLVLTSALLNLYEGRPHELRFVVGRELGRIKCDGLKLRQVSFGLLTILQRIDVSLVPAEAQTALLTYAAARFVTWSRAAEIGADRAGLFCCGDPQIAYDALLRQLHGLKADSQWIDPQSPEFHAEAVLQRFQRWEQEPVVSAIRYLHRQSLDSPYIVERLAALKQYVDSGQYEQVLQHSGPSHDKAITTLERLELTGLAPKGQGVYAYVKAYVGDELVLTTPTAPYGSVANFDRFRMTLSETAGEPIFFEIWNDGRVYDELVGGFVVYPPLPSEGSQQSIRHTRILRDWKDRTPLVQSGLASVKLRTVPVPAR